MTPGRSQHPQPVAEQLRASIDVIRQLKAEVARYRSRDREPIAIVGASCRLPGGVETLEAYWSLLEDGRDTVREVPPSRWDAAALYDPDPACPGKTYTRHAAMLEDVAGFDADFFGISPREAEAMDPQHRLALELSWEALETACIDPRGLKGSATGVFLGLASSDYSLPLLGDRDSIDAYVASGNAHGAAAGRISFLLGLQGPSMALDTACSSSLTAVHLAVRSLRLGECDLALAGGLNLLLAPELTINFSKARMLAPDGHCKTFDAAADGFVRGEGGGVVALRRLSDALERREPILALIAGTAVNHDGATSGLTVPSGPAQERVIRQALDNAGLSPEAIGYVEAHGTGTALGDPIEMNALARVFAGRKAPLAVGSVKTNIGHLEGGAGVAGLLKAALCVARGRIPASLHWTRLNPRIELGETPIEVAAEARNWPAETAPRAAGVSSFGFGGTNAHVVVTQPPAAEETQPETAQIAQLLVLSARTPEALQAVAGRLRDWLAEAAPGSGRYADLCYSSQLGRTALPARLAIFAPSPERVRALLDLAARGAGLAGQQDVLAGVVTAKPEPLGEATDARSLAWAFVRGRAIDWAHHWQGLAPRRFLPFPTYPFSRIRFWAPAAEPGQKTDAPQATGDAPPPEPAITEDSAARAVLAGLSEPEQLRWLTDYVRREVARVLRYAPPRLPDVDASLFEIGLDSIMAVDMSLTFEVDFGFEIPQTTVIDHPTPSAVARYIHSRLSETHEAARSASPPLPEPSASGGDSAADSEAAERLRHLIATIRAERAAIGAHLRDPL
jgi:acyl transferase domain-containing protein